MKKSVLIIMVLFLALSACEKKPLDYHSVESYPDIFPDYTEVTIPFNIAPLNFKPVETCTRMYVEISGKKQVVKMMSKSQADIHAKEWAELLVNNAGDSIMVAVWLEKDGMWKSYLPFPIYIKKEPIDSHLAYRLIAPGYQVWSTMGIYQRSLNDFNQQAIVTNRLFPGACMNCHSFRQNDPKHMMIHLRMPGGGTILNIEENLTKLNTKTEETMSNFQYPYWHPGGNYIAYSINKTAQSFHSASENRIEVFDSSSDVIVYDIQRNTILSSPLLKSEEWFETFPTFSPDGNYLYYCTAQAKKMPEDYDLVKYNLCRIAFNPIDGTFGTQADTLVSVKESLKSVSFPRISPNGKFLMFTLSDYGNFSIWHKEADLYLLNLENGITRKMNEINSDDVESYHSWASGSQWFVFSSRRIDGLYTRPYFSFLNNDGIATKPFLLPQKNPDFYMNTFYSFNIPEFIAGKVSLNLAELEKELKGAGKDVTFMQTHKK